MRRIRNKTLQNVHWKSLPQTQDLIEQEKKKGKKSLTIGKEEKETMYSHDILYINWTY